MKRRIVLALSLVACGPEVPGTLSAELAAGGGIQGPVEVRVVDRLDGREEIEVDLLRAGKRLRLRGPKVPPGLMSGDVVRVEGALVEGGVAAESVELLEAGAGCSPLGAQNLAVLLVAPPGVTPAVD